MAVKKKRTTPTKGKRKTSAESRPSVGRKVPFEETFVEDNGMGLNGNGLAELAMMGDEEGDPDVTALAQEEELLEEEELDLKSPEVVAELSEDPVRLYLREIGQVKLLDADSEFRLATLIEADRLVAAFLRRPQRRGVSVSNGVYRMVISELVASWERLEEDAKRLGCELPDLSLVLAEALTLQLGWSIEEPSYLRAYLDNGLWGQDPTWDSMVRKAFSVFMCLYLLPSEFANWLLIHLQQHHKYFGVRGHTE